MRTLRNIVLMVETDTAVNLKMRNVHHGGDIRRGVAELTAVAKSLAISCDALWRKRAQLLEAVEEKIEGIKRVIAGASAHRAGLRSQRPVSYRAVPTLREQLIEESIVVASRLSWFSSSGTSVRHWWRSSAADPIFSSFIDVVHCH